MTKKKVTMTYKCWDGEEKQIAFDVENGKTPFDKWVSLPANKGKHFQDYYKTLKGSNGSVIVTASINEI